MTEFIDSQLINPHSSRMTVDPSVALRGCAVSSVRIPGPARERGRFAVAPVVVARGKERSTAGKPAAIAGIAAIRKIPIKWASNVGQRGAAESSANCANAPCADSNTGDVPQIPKIRSGARKSPRLADSRSAQRGLEQFRDSRGWPREPRYNTTSILNRCRSRLPSPCDGGIRSSTACPGAPIVPRR
jgi:hypothetical protein